MSPLVGARGDRYEQEANRFADDFARGSSFGRILERQTDASQAIARSPLREFESRLGFDFSNVRVHSDARAEAAARGLHARAFTIGQDIFARPSALASPGAPRLLAHEIAHVAQQARDASAPVIQRNGDDEEELHKETNQAIGDVTDPELAKVLAAMEPRVQQAFISGATGKAAQRALKTVQLYQKEGVDLSYKTRKIGDRSPYKEGGRANFLDILGSKRRADEFEHLRAKAAGKVVLEDATSKWARESRAIVLAEAHSRIKTPMDNKLTKDLKDGKISADDWLRHSGTNAYESWFEARARGVTVPTAEEFATAVLEQERELKIRYYRNVLAKLDRIQQKAQADAATVANVQNLLAPRRDFMGAQEVSLEGAAVGLNMAITGFVGQTVASVLDPGEAPAEAAEILEVAEAVQVAKTASTGIRVAETASVATTGIRIGTGIRVITIEALRDAAAAQEAEAIAEIAETEAAVAQLKPATTVIP